MSSEETETASIPSAPTGLPPLPIGMPVMREKSNGLPLPGKSPYELGFNREKNGKAAYAGQVLIETVEGKKKKKKSKVNEKFHYSQIQQPKSTPRSRSPRKDGVLTLPEGSLPPLSDRSVEPKNPTKADKRLAQTMELTKAIHTRKGDTALIDDPQSNVYLGMQVRNDARERKLDKKQEKRFERKYQKQVQKEEADHHVRDIDSAHRPEMQKVLHSVGDNNGINHSVSKTGEFARNTAAWTLLHGNNQPTIKDDIDRDYERRKQEHNLPTSPRPCSPPLPVSATPRVSVTTNKPGGISIVSTKRDSSRGTTFHAINAQNKIDHESDYVAPPPPNDFVALEISMPDETPPEPAPTKVVHSATILEPSLRLFKRDSRMNTARRDSVSSSGTSGSSYDSTSGFTGTNRISLPGSLE